MRGWVFSNLNGHLDSRYTHIPLSPEAISISQKLALNPTALYAASFVAHLFERNKKKKRRRKTEKEGERRGGGKKREKKRRGEKRGEEKIKKERRREKKKKEKKKGRENLSHLEARN